MRVLIYILMRRIVFGASNFGPLVFHATTYPNLDQIGEGQLSTIPCSFPMSSQHPLLQWSGASLPPGMDCVYDR